MNDADKYTLAVSMLRRIVRMVEEANDDEDADPWLILEDIQTAADDALLHVGGAPS